MTGQPSLSPGESPPLSRGWSTTSGPLTAWPSTRRPEMGWWGRTTAPSSVPGWRQAACPPGKYSGKSRSMKTKELPTTPPTGSYLNCCGEITSGLCVRNMVTECFTNQESRTRRLPGPRTRPSSRPGVREGLGCPLLMPT